MKVIAKRVCPKCRRAFRVDTFEGKRCRECTRAAPPQPPPPEPEPDPNVEPPTLVKLDTDGFEVWCDGVRALSNRLVFLSVFGVQTSVRSFWARLVEKRNASVQVGDSSLYLDGEVRYLTLRSLLAPQYLHMVCMHPSATSVVSPFADRFYLIGDDPAARFWPRFTRMCQVPMRPTWREAIWALGVKEKLIEPLSGFGIEGHMVQTGSDGWADHVKKAIKKGRLV